MKYFFFGFSLFQKNIIDIRAFEMKADEAISLLAGFDIGEDVYYIERIRKIGNKAIILDTNIFLRSETKGLTKEIAENPYTTILKMTSEWILRQAADV